MVIVEIFWVDGRHDCLKAEGNDFFAQIVPRQSINESVELFLVDSQSCLSRCKVKLFTKSVKFAVIKLTGT